MQNLVIHVFTSFFKEKNIVVSDSLNILPSRLLKAGKNIPSFNMDRTLIIILQNCCK